MKKIKEQRRMLYTPAELRVRENAEGSSESSRVITGYAILFNEPSAPLWEDSDGCAREVIDPSAVNLDLLNSSDIKMTMFHDRQLILARSNKGTGTLNYEIDERGVSFSFEAPRTADGDKALELVRRGDLAGCSFAFTTRYWDDDFVVSEVANVGGKVERTYRVKAITGIYDFTLAADPAYPSTSVETEQRELVNKLRSPSVDDTSGVRQIQEMREEASKTIL